MRTCRVVLLLFDLSMHISFNGFTRLDRRFRYAESFSVSQRETSLPDMAIGDHQNRTRNAW